MDKIKVGVLGATGLVGQVFVSLLAEHPWFELEYLGASKASAGKKYKEVAKGYCPLPLPSSITDEIVREVKPEEIPNEIEILFSALPSQVAENIEVDLAKRGFVVISNASPLRLDEDIPLINPEVNLDHLDLIHIQKKNRKWKGVIVKNPNCTTAILTLTLKPLMDNFGIKRVIVTTMQGLSGAGYPGVPSLQIVDNLIPFIPKEEYKVENETLKILGNFTNNRILVAKMRITATCTRVPVLDGHTEAVFVELYRETTPEEVMKVFNEFKSKPQEMKLPTAPERPIVVKMEEDRPQPRLDRLEGRGMSVVVGRIRLDEALTPGIKYVALGHNLLRGAAGIAVLIAEAMVKMGYINLR